MDTLRLMNAYSAIAKHCVQINSALDFCIFSSVMRVQVNIEHGTLSVSCKEGTSVAHVNILAKYMSKIAPGWVHMDTSGCLHKFRVSKVGSSPKQILADVTGIRPYSKKKHVVSNADDVVIAPPCQKKKAVEHDVFDISALPAGAKLDQESLRVWYQVVPGVELESSFDGKSFRLMTSVPIRDTHVIRVAMALMLFRSTGTWKAEKSIHHVEFTWTPKGGPHALHNVVRVVSEVLPSQPDYFMGFPEVGHATIYRGIEYVQKFVSEWKDICYIYDSIQTALQDWPNAMIAP